jgi:hypothetical protein
MAPCFRSFSAIDKFSKNNALNSCFAVIHQPYSRHLATGFQLLGYTISLHHPWKQSVHPLLSGIANVQQVGRQFSTDSQLLS